MEKIILKATERERSEKSNQLRKAGFTPGVLNGRGMESVSVKFETIALNKIISKHGRNAKLWVDLGDEKKFGYIKEVQRQPVEGNVIHVAIQIVSKDQEIKMKLPIVFQGQAELEHHLFKLQVCKSEIEVEGKTELIPDVAVADVSGKTAGENITALDFHLPPDIKVLDAEHEIYAVVKAVAVKEEQAAEAAEASPAE